VKTIRVKSSSALAVDSAAAGWAIFESVGNGSIVFLPCPISLSRHMAVVSRLDLQLVSFDLRGKLIQHGNLLTNLNIVALS